MCRKWFVFSFFFFGLCLLFVCSFCFLFVFLFGCLTLQGKPLLESGTQGAKGHVQVLPFSSLCVSNYLSVILPFQTPNYGSDVDPPEDGFAYCTVKSFPGKIVHTIQWARERFNKNFQDIPSETSQFRIDSQKPGYWDVCYGL